MLDVSYSDAVWIQTFTGRKFNLFQPDPEQVDIEDIATALSNLCRFTGHTRKFYSVAQHSVLVSHHVRPGIELEALLHDAAEAYVGDMNRPLKHSGKLDFFRTAENQIYAAIAIKFDLKFLTVPAEIKIADNRALFTEQRDLLGAQVEAWKESAPPFDEKIYPMSPEFAREHFMDRFHKLMEERADVQAQLQAA